MKKLLLLPLAIFALTACDNGKDPVDTGKTEPGTSDPVKDDLPKSEVAPEFRGLSLGSGQLTIYVNAPAKCTFSADGYNDTVMTDVSTEDKYAHTVALDGTYNNSTVTCENTAGKKTKTYGNLVVGG